MDDDNEVRLSSNIEDMILFCLFSNVMPFLNKRMLPNIRKPYTAGDGFFGQFYLFVEFFLLRY